MIFKSIIQDMWPKSHRVVEAGGNEGGDIGGGTCCWANLPQELLREILIKIEASESAWPTRRSVVAVAGVCRNWREITREIVKVPELSGYLTFPISVKQVQNSYLFSFSIFNYGFCFACVVLTFISKSRFRFLCYYQF